MTPITTIEMENTTHGAIPSKPAIAAVCASAPGTAQDSDVLVDDQADVVMDTREYQPSARCAIIPILARCAIPACPTRGHASGAIRRWRARAARRAGRLNPPRQIQRRKPGKGQIQGERLGGVQLQILETNDTGPSDGGRQSAVDDGVGQHQGIGADPAIHHTVAIEFARRKGHGVIARPP
ncbi:hypothetical protein BN940_11331 [Castellaniella defragrans 65Phen]|uniref:Uncharacterized protein n=1 Tax=Castellaniella defragrans (strain DSM 12143 / CCUG 39792 / 65Phen) TaxID=1437824 RepID=W8X9F3_CASD6|nr:hypothetical protein BN940_11331 [Castellaniella defragrans 65Phen]